MNAGGILPEGVGSRYLQNTQSLVQMQGQRVCQKMVFVNEHLKTIPSGPEKMLGNPSPRELMQGQAWAFYFRDFRATRWKQSGSEHTAQKTKQEVHRTPSPLVLTFRNLSIP